MCIIHKLSPVRDQHSNLAKSFVLQSRAEFQTVKCPLDTLLWRLLSKSGENTGESWLVWLLAFCSAVKWVIRNFKTLFLDSNYCSSSSSVFCRLFLYYSYCSKVSLFFIFSFNFYTPFLTLYFPYLSLAMRRPPLPSPPPTHGHPLFYLAAHI